jgi:regulatory protein
MKSTPDPGELRERALRLLARREHSRVELARKLEQTGFVREDIAPLLDEFEGKEWLSDRRFTESYVADHRAKAGRIKLAYDLRQRGVTDNIIQAVLEDNYGSEIECAREVWRRKFHSVPTDAAEKARQMRFLQSRGFAMEVIRRIINRANDS